MGTPLRILVIEDNPAFQQDAREQLANHDVTVFSNFDMFRDDRLFKTPKTREKYNFSTERKPLTDYNVLMTDGQLPTWDAKQGSTQIEAPSGLVIFLFALFQGVQRIALLSSAAHTEDPIMRGMTDLFGKNARVVNLGSVRLLTTFEAVEFRGQERHKRWDRVLTELLKD